MDSSNLKLNSTNSRAAKTALFLGASVYQLLADFEAFAFCSTAEAWVNGKSGSPSPFARCSSIIQACVRLQNEKQLLQIEKQLGDLAFSCLHINQRIFTHLKEERLESKLKKGEWEPICDDKLIDLSELLDDDDLVRQITLSKARKRRQMKFVIDAFRRVIADSPSDFRPIFELGRCLTEIPLLIRRGSSEDCHKAADDWFGLQLIDYQKLLKANVSYLPNCRDIDATEIDIDKARFEIPGHLDLLLPGFFSEEHIFGLVYESNIETRKSVEAQSNDKATREKSMFEPDDCPKEARQRINGRLDPQQIRLLNILWPLETGAALTSEELGKVLSQEVKEATVARSLARKTVCETNDKLENLMGPTTEAKKHPIIENTCVKSGRGAIASYRLSFDAKVRIRAITRSNRNN
jgi:hypothetical protein